MRCSRVQKPAQASCSQGAAGGDRRRWCELCDHGATVTVHHVATLAQLGKPGPDQPAWAALMARKRRKTLIVCRSCHDYIHANPVANAA